MSEPLAALMQVHIRRAALDRWLESPPSPASRWSDWRAIDGRWYIEGKFTLAEASDTAIADILREVDSRIVRVPDNRTLLHYLLDVRYDPDDYPAHLATFDQFGEIFVAASLFYSENLQEIVQFLAMSRSIADHLAPNEHGSAIIHNYMWGTEVEQTTTAMLVMMPAGESYLLQPPVTVGATSAFLPIADALVEGRLPEGFSMRYDYGLFAALRQ